MKVKLWRGLRWC
jgi:hypothetical protein